MPMNNKLAKVELRDFLNRHYWRDGKGCSCDFWVGDYNTWMAIHAIPLLLPVISRLLDAAHTDALEQAASLVHTFCDPGKEFSKWRVERYPLAAAIRAVVSQPAQPSPKRD